ncbi:MAG: radical SAM family heme chaperone HemW [Sphingobacteriaceae bacterium]
MSGIYIHVPFCKKACHYCDFHFSTSLKYKSEMIAGLLHEIALQKNYLGEEEIATIYFGGGTPSLLEVEEIEKILAQIHQYFPVRSDAEITLEANPDDLNAAKVSALRNSPINRFSIGIQSFFEEDLRWMNRSHTASEAESSIKRVQDAGFENITADLIYGYPLLSDKKWQHNIQLMTALAVTHLSCYAMTVEQGTALHHFIQRGKQIPINESQSAEQFVQLMDELAKAGFTHYEISNFARPGKESQHNANYWKGRTYLGIGPSAHSFNGHSRQWNVANNSKYLSEIFEKRIPATSETLTANNRFNEYIMASLRTIWGVDEQKIKLDFGEDYLEKLKNKSADFKDKNWIRSDNEKLYLTQEGKLFADHIASELFIIDDE